VPTSRNLIVRPRLLDFDVFTGLPEALRTGFPWAQAQGSEIGAPNWSLTYSARFARFSVRHRPAGCAPASRLRSLLRFSHLGLV